MTGAVKRITENEFLDSDEMGQGLLQWLIIELLRPLIVRLLQTRSEADTGRVKERIPLVGADTYFYFVQGDSKQWLAPDVYVLPGVDPASAPASWSLWEIPHPPSFAVEIVGAHVAKDYDTIWKVYDRIGTRELVVFDPNVSSTTKPLALGTAKRVLVRWQIWRRDENGAFTLVERSNEDRVQSLELACWLRVVGEDSERRLRVGTGLRGELLVPTGDELAASERAEKEREREGRAKERLEAEAKIRALEAQIAKLSSRKPRAKSKRK